MIALANSSSGDATQRPKIVISANTSWNIVNFRTRLVQALQADGYDVVALAPPDEFSARLRGIGCEFRPLPMDNKGTSPLADLALTWRYRQALREIKPAAYLGYTIKPNVYGTLAARSLGIPTINNVSGLGTAFIRDNLLTKIVKGLYRYSIGKHAFRVFFQNPEDRELFVQLGLARAERTDVLPGSGIDLERFVPAPAPQRPADATHFLLIARLLWDKGVGEYVEAARLLRARYPSCQFQIAGMLDVENQTAIDRKSVDGWVAEGVIDYLGSLDDVRPAIAHSDCVVLPSYREGAPRTLLEAAAMARPVIATDVPGCRQVVDNGTTGLLCHARDAIDLAAKMETLIRLSPDERRAMGQAGRLMCEKSFDDNIVIRFYTDALREALSTSRAKMAG